MFKHHIVLTVGVLCALAMVTTGPEAEAAHRGRRTRQGRWDVFLAWHALGGDTTDIRMDYEAPPAAPVRGDGVLRLHDTGVYGIGVGYNITERFNLNATVTFGSVRLQTQGVDTGDPATDAFFHTRDSHDIFMGDLNLDYYFVRGSITPMITGGAGLVHVRGDLDGLDGNIDHDVKGSTPSYNFGLGLRWDLSQRTMLRFVYRNTWTKLKNTEDTVRLDGWGLNLGMMF